MTCRHQKLRLNWNILAHGLPDDLALPENDRPVRARHLRLDLACDDCGEALCFVGVPKFDGPTFDCAIVDETATKLEIPCAPQSEIAHDERSARIHDMPEDWRTGLHAKRSMVNLSPEATALKPAEITIRCNGKEETFTADRLGDAVCALGGAWAEADPDGARMLAAERASFLVSLRLTEEQVHAAMHGERGPLN